MQPTGPTTTSATSSNTPSAVQTFTLFNHLQLLTPSLSKEGVLSITLPNGQILSQTTSAQLSLQLNQQLAVVIQNQSAQLYLPQMLTSNAVQLNAALVNSLRNWLKSGSDRKFENLPDAIKSLLLGSVSKQPKNFQFLALKLVGQKLQFVGTEQSPVMQIQLNTSDRPTDNKSLLHLLQLSIPIALDTDESSVWVEQEQNAKNDSASSIRFKMRFDLKELGVLNIDVQLEEFTLRITSQSSTKKLFQKNTEVWPKMQQRFEDLGFAVSVQNALVEAKAIINKKPPNSSHLLDVKA